MIIGVLKEGAVNENRVALIPAHASELLKINADVMVERGAGAAAGFSDAEYQEKQCRLAAREDILSKADILLAVRAAAANTKTGEADIRALKEGATVIATMEPYAKHAAFTVMAQRKHRAFALEKLPRITRGTKYGCIIFAGESCGVQGSAYCGSSVAAYVSDDDDSCRYYCAD